jgi:hypothetical protein
MRRPAAAAATLMILTAGCASSASSTAAGGGAGPTASGGRTTSGMPARKIELGFAANDHTVSAHPGDVITVRLDSTYWKFQPVTGGVLTRGTFVSRPMHGHIVPGSGAGAVVATFRVLKAGTAQVSAARQSCGEAMRCVGGQGSFTMTVVVH